MTQSASAMLIWLLLAAGSDAAPWPRHTIDNTSRGADGVRLADVNGDRLLDIATGWEEGGLIRVYVNPGPQHVKKPWPAVTVGHVKSPEDAVLVDLDGDHALDVVSCCEGSNRTVYVHWAPSDPDQYLRPPQWQTTPITCTAKKQMWMFALPLQLDGQHGTDLVVGSKGSDGSICWLQCPHQARQGGEWQLYRLCDAGWIMSLQGIDMDNDGDMDVLASDRKGANRGIFWLANPGHQQTLDGVLWEKVPVGAADREVMFLASGTYRNAGQRDVFCAVRGRGISHLFCPDIDLRQSWKHREIAMPAGYGTGKGVALGDINNDGCQDLTFSCENAKGDLSGIAWMSETRNRPDHWTHHNISGPDGIKFDRLELLDLDADGDLDVLTCEERHNLGVIWYENPGRE